MNPETLPHIPPALLRRMEALGFVPGSGEPVGWLVAEARAGRCHRAWAAPFLVRAGWRVVLDGVEVAGG